MLVLAHAAARHADVRRGNAQIEKGRTTAELLRDELQLAGFFGEVLTEGASYDTPDPCQTTPTTFGTSPRSLPTPIRGYAAADNVGCLTARSRLAGTDALALRRVGVQTVNPESIGAANAQYYVQGSVCREDVTAPPWVFDKQPAAFLPRSRACGAPNIARAYVARTYFVASCNVCGSDHIPTLKRLDLQGGTLVETALVEGVESFRLEYGFDADDDGHVDSWRTLPAATGAESLWQNVMALRVHYIVRSPDREVGHSPISAQHLERGGGDAETTAGDGFVRQAYSMTVRLIYPSGARGASSLSRR